MQRRPARRPDTGQTGDQRSVAPADTRRLASQLLRRRGGSALALVASLACQSPALVRTARTLPAGGNDLSLSLNVTRISLREKVIEPSVPLQEFDLPNPLPDILYEHGVTDDIGLGARVSLGSGLLEAHSTLRFVHAARGTLHVAVAPALGYRVLALVNGPVVTLPLIVTYDVGSNMSLSGGPVLSFASYSVPSQFDLGDLDLRGDTLYAGGGVGIEFRPAFGLHVMPTLEVQRSVSRRGDIEDLPVVDMLFFGVTFGWGSRRDPAGDARTEDRIIEGDAPAP